MSQRKFDYNEINLEKKDRIVWHAVFVLMLLGIGICCLFFQNAYENISSNALEKLEY